MAIHKKPDDLVASAMQLFDQFVGKLPDQSYFLSHRARFEKTLSFIPPAGTPDMRSFAWVLARALPDGA